MTALITRSVRGSAAGLAILIAMASVSIVVLPAVRAAAAGTSTPVIIDTDIYSNTDDEGALAVAFGLQLEGSANVLAIGIDTRTSRPQVATSSWQCAAAITQFYGFRDVPIGSDMPDNGTTVNSPDMVGPCAAFASPSTPQPTAVVPLYRRTLASQPDGSVVMVGIGYEENLAGLLASPPDSISPLSGSALVAEKVKELVIMGGGYPSRAGENNLIGNPTAAEAVAASWPTKVVYSGYEVGFGVFTGHTLSSVHPANSPVRVAYEALVGAGKNNRSFDVTALYHALQPSDPLLSEVGPGTNVVDASGDNVFTPGAGDEYYLSAPNPVALQNTLEGWMDVLPGTSPQTISFTSTAPSTAPLGSTYAPSATGGASGDPVTFAIDPSSTSGCAYSGSTGLVTFAAPTGSCVIDADEGGSTVYAEAPRVSQSVTVGTIAQSISFTTSPPASPKVGDTYAVGATASSGLPVAISIDTSSTSGCTYNTGTRLVTFTGPAGTCTIDADQSGNSTYAAAPRVTQSVTVGTIAQSISFTTSPPASPKVGDTYAVGATASSGLPVAISIDVSSTSGCTYSQGTKLVTFAGPAGTCTIDADQSGNSTYAAAPRVTQSVGVGVLAQTISFTTSPPASPKVGDTYAVGASASSGLPVAISIDASSTSGCTYSQGTKLVTFTGPAGTCTIDADQSGNATYAAAPRVTQSVGVGVLAQTISFTTSPPASPKVGDTYAVGATASSSLPVAISIDASSTSGCTYSQGTKLVTFAGPVGTCTIDADQSGSATYAAAPRVSQSVAVSVRAQSISFTSSAPASPKVGDVYLVGATASSGLPVAISIDPSSTSGCAYAQGTGLVTFAAPAGTCTIDADQSGNATYAAAPRVSQSVTVGAIAQSITFTSSPPASPKVGDVYLVGATASSGLPVTLSIDPSSTSGCAYAQGTGLVTFAAPAGTCTIDADQSGNATYAAAPRVSQVIGVGVLAQSITFTSSPPASPKVGDVYLVGATASSGLPVAISIDPSSTSGCAYAQSTGLVTFAAPAGTCTIDADQSGNATYAAAPRVTQVIGVGVLAQSISFTTSPPASPKVGDTYAVGATASSGLPVAISIDGASSSGCTYSQGTGLVAFAGPAGTCTIDADQSGNAAYGAAPRVQQSVSVAKAPQSIAFTSTPPASPHPGQSFQVTASASSGLSVSLSVDAVSGASCSLSGNTLTVLTTGPCVVDANQPGNGGYLPATQVQQLEVRGAQSVRFTSTAPSNPHVFSTYAVAASATSGLPVAISIDAASSAGCTYSASSRLVTFTGPSGTCIVDANQSGSTLYAAAPLVQQSVKVAKATQSISYTTQAPTPNHVGGTYAVKATATSKLPVALTIDGTARSVCSIASGTVTFLKKGTCIIDANQSGNASWSAAGLLHQYVAVTS